MTLLLAEIDVLETVGDPTAVDVRGVEHDSRRVAPGDLFCCVPGRGTDGHDHVPEAVARGAVGLLCERVEEEGIGPPVVQARVARGAVRPAMARVAAAFHGHPARDLMVVGVTGTNGKTTVTQLLGAIFRQAGRVTEVIGTLSGARTTPEAPELQARLAEVRDRGRATGAPDRPAVAMEVSSHALVQSRVDAVEFDVAVFTNLSHDHLDFHGSMDAYFEAKAALFEPERSARAVVQVDDEWGRRLYDRLVSRPGVPPVAVRRADAAELRLGLGRSTFTWRGLPVDLPLVGAVNVDNALLAAEAAVAAGLPAELVAAGLGAAAPVPGRLELVVEDPCPVMVDYAHTPAGLDVVLAESRRLVAGGRVLVVFGCGGNRDRAKRPLMGAAAVGGADLAFLTDDNPRDEDPRAIIDEVLAGVPADRRDRLVVEPDRRRAIEAALRGARPQDLVVVAGKGHETYQEIAGVRFPFDDRLVVAEVAAALASGVTGSAADKGGRP